MVKFRHNSDLHNLPKSNHSSQNRPKPKSTKTIVSMPIIILYLHVISCNPKKTKNKKKNKNKKTKNKTKTKQNLARSPPKKPHKFQQILSNPNIKERVFLMRQLTLSGIHKVDFFTKMSLYPFLLNMNMVKKHFHFLYSDLLF